MRVDPPHSGKSQGHRQAPDRKEGTNPETSLHHLSNEKYGTRLTSFSLYKGMKSYPAMYGLL